jgi:hypothetical protein
MGRFKLIQEPQYIETLLLGLYHQENVYTVVEENTGKTAFSIREESNICFRCTPLLHCPPSNRPYAAKIFNAQGGLVATVDRPCQCSILCICRPYVDVKDPSNTPIGKVVNPCPAFLCCNMKCEIFNEQNMNEYDISVCVCNFHVCCECCAGPCQETAIAITTKPGMDYTQLPTSLKKVWSGFGKECYSAANEYIFEVPDIWNEGQWAKFLASLQLFDMLFFEQMWQCWCIGNFHVQHYTC